MSYFSNTPVGRFRLVAVIEGISYLFLLFVGMPLKYGFDLPQVTTYTGWIHGGLFLLYILTLIKANSSENWKRGRVLWAVLAALIPFGAFILERKLYREEQLKLQEIRA